VSPEDPTSDAKASEQQLRPLKRTLSRLWLFSPERLWLLSISLQRHGRWRLAFMVKQLNTVLYHNSLSPNAIVSSDIALGHYAHGVVVNGNVEIGEQVKIWHNVTLTAGRRARDVVSDGEDRPSRIVIEQGAKLGTNAVVIAPRGQCLRIGRGARVGAGAIVTRDVPAGATVVSPSARILLADERSPRIDRQSAAADVLSSDSSDAAPDAVTDPAPSEDDGHTRPHRDAPLPP
jgi:serine O-acetyltransferase